MSVLVVTSLGDIVIDLHTDRCPLTTKNFLKLCKIKYYNGCLFHTVQKDFTAQAGDPSGRGTGGDSIYKFLYGEQARFFGDEIHPDLKHSKKGTVSMASAGENLNASQFYFTLRDDLDYLDGKHTVFGEVAEGFDTLTRINDAFVDENGRPYKNIRVKHTYILDDPFDDPPQFGELIPEASPEGKPPDEIEDVRLEDDWVPLDEELDPAQLEESMREKEAHSHAVVLEMIGDIPDAEIKPPENVLFVCKLNPVTQEEDLEIIFSRFGKVTSADIIRDYKTGDSLCYAFIEFETQESCEAAYFKMDNVLIDDRRIHVDFSQSVSRLWTQYRQGGKRTQDLTTGKGCFKCGAVDHYARDCTGGSDKALAAPNKYVLKNDDKQRGNQQKSYEMVFNDDDDALQSESPQEALHADQKIRRSSDNKRDGRNSQHGEGHRDHHMSSHRHDSRRHGQRNADSIDEDRTTDTAKPIRNDKRYVDHRHEGRDDSADKKSREGRGQGSREFRDDPDRGRSRYRDHDRDRRRDGWMDEGEKDSSRKYHDRDHEHEDDPMEKREKIVERQDHDRNRGRDVNDQREKREKEGERKRTREDDHHRRNEFNDGTKSRDGRDRSHTEYYKRDSHRDRVGDHDSDHRGHYDRESHHSRGDRRREKR